MEDRDEMPGRVLAACLLVARGLPVLAVLFVAAMHSSACESLLLALSVSSGHRSTAHVCERCHPPNLTGRLGVVSGT